MGMDAVRHLHHPRPTSDFLMGEVQVVEKRRTKATGLEAERQKQAADADRQKQEAASPPLDANIRKRDKEMVQATVTNERIGGAATTGAGAVTPGAAVKCSLVLLSSQVR
jgi:hypothetical protein